MKIRFFTLPLVSLAVGLLLSGCVPTGTPPTALTVAVRDGAYEPAALQAPAGKPVRLMLDNQDRVQHQVAIEDIALATQGGTTDAMAGMDHEMPGGAEMPPVHLVAAPGTQVAVEFIPTQAGQYTVRCLEPSHTETGTLTVTRR